MSRTALLLINRYARQGQSDLSQALELLKRSGFTLLEESTEHPEALSSTIVDYRDRVDLVIVGGGDGTLNAAIAGLVETQLPLGILPLGTANDLARTLGLPSALIPACQVIVDGKVHPIDLGWVNGKYFFNVASLGLSVQITRQLDSKLKKRWGVLAYALTALRVLLETRPFRAKLLIDGKKVKTAKTVQIAVGNGRHYGGGMTVAEGAAINDQLLDVYSLNLKHWWQLIPLLPAMRSGDHTNWSFVDGFSCKELRVETRRPHSINTDGEITTETPATFRVMPRAIRVMVPAAALADPKRRGLREDQNF